jgi:hypothetical protein
MDWIILPYMTGVDVMLGLVNFTFLFWNYPLQKIGGLALIRFVSFITDSTMKL